MQKLKLRSGRPRKLPASFKYKRIPVTVDLFVQLKTIKDLHEVTVKFWANMLNEDR